MKIRHLPIALLAPLILIACANEEPPATGPAWNDGVVWVLDADSVALLEPEAPPTANVTIVFDGGDLSGNAGCNTYGGTYQADGSDLTIHVGAMTEMACEEPLMALEAAFLAALGDVTTFHETVDGLTLTGGATTLTFATEPPAEPLPLTGTTWVLTSIATGDAVSSTVAGTEVSLDLADDGQASGTAGCNRFSGGYEVDGTSLGFGPLAATKMFCDEEGVMEQEQSVFAALEASRSFTIDGSTLTLADESGAMLLTFEGSPAEA
jgi:heat shock protein HslJ